MMKKIIFLYLSLLVGNLTSGQNAVNDYFGNAIIDFNYYKKNCNQNQFSLINSSSSQTNWITVSNHLSYYNISIGNGNGLINSDKYIKLGNTINIGNSANPTCENEKYTTSFNSNYINSSFKISGFVFFRGSLINTNSNFSIETTVQYNDGTNFIFPLPIIINPSSPNNLASATYSDVRVFKIDYLVDLNQYIDFFKNPIVKITVANNDSPTTQVMSCFNIKNSKTTPNIVIPSTLNNQNCCFNNSYIFGFPTISSIGTNGPQATDTLLWGIKKYNNGQLITEETISYNPTSPSLSVNFSNEGFDAFKIIAKISRLINGVPIVLTLDETFKTITDCTSSDCRDDCSSFDLIPNEKYLISGWVASDHNNLASISEAAIEVKFIGQNEGQLGTQNTFYPSGKIIDGWQRIQGEFLVPNGASNILISLQNTSAYACYFDDIRVLPSKGNMKSFVYDQATQRLMAELDENNYATFYEYDLEGGLIRIKKETEKGVFTIQETRSSNSKN